MQTLNLSLPTNLGPDPNWVPIKTNYRTKTVDDFYKALGSRVIGQPEAVDALTSIYSKHLAGMTPAGRPIGNLLLLGPTGTGKTRSMEALAEILVGDPRALIKIDCGEFQHSHEIAKLIGSPPGYLGHRETHPLLSQEVLNQFHTDKCKISFVLFDEIEKASDALWNLLLGILDKARLTLGDNRRVDFSRAIIGCTSNVGASQLFGNVMGFVRADDDVTVRDYREVEATVLEAARRKFTPEFINRFDKKVVYHPLSQTDIENILTIELAAVEKLLVDQGLLLTLKYTDGARAFLKKEGFDKRYGARELKRAIDTHLVGELATAKLLGAIVSGDTVRVDVDESGRSLSLAKRVNAVSA